MVPKHKEEMDNVGSESPPPILGSWRNLYFLVIGNLALMVMMFYLFTLAFK